MVTPPLPVVAPELVDPELVEPELVEPALVEPELPELVLCPAAPLDDELNATSSEVAHAETTARQSGAARRASAAAEDRGARFNIDSSCAEGEENSRYSMLHSMLGEFSSSLA